MLRSRYSFCGYKPDTIVVDAGAVGELTDKAHAVVALRLGSDGEWVHETPPKVVHTASSRLCWRELRLGGPVLSSELHNRRAEGSGEEGRLHLRVEMINDKSQLGLRQLVGKATLSLHAVCERTDEWVAVRSDLIDTQGEAMGACVLHVRFRVKAEELSLNGGEDSGIIDVCQVAVSRMQLGKPCSGAPTIRCESCEF